MSRPAGAEWPYKWVGSLHAACEAVSSFVADSRGTIHERRHQCCEAVLLLRSWRRRLCKHGLPLKKLGCLLPSYGWGYFDLKASDGTPAGET